MDDLFQERLDALLDKSLSDISHFAAREHRSVEEVRRRVAEWHARYLFAQPLLAGSSARLDRTETSALSVAADNTRVYRYRWPVRTILVEASRALETLHVATNVHYLVLAVDPLDSTDPGFVGGTALARGFWHALRGGGEKGIAALRAQASGATELPMASQLPNGNIGKTPAIKLKTEVYSRVRAALRTVSGVRNADMKWTNHSNLSSYGVRIEGWPSRVPHQNPSTLSVAHNTTLKAALDAGTLRFCRLGPSVAAAEVEEQLPWDFLHESLDPNVPSPAPSQGHDDPTMLPISPPYRSEGGSSTH